MGAETRPNPYSSLELIMEGKNVTVTVMGDMQPASAEWYQEAFEKMNEIFSRYGFPANAGPILQSDLA